MLTVNTREEYASALQHCKERYPLVVVDFFAPWCSGCRTLYPKLRQIASANLDVAFIKVPSRHCTCSFDGLGYYIIVLHPVRHPGPRLQPLLRFGPAITISLLESFGSYDVTSDHVICHLKHFLLACTHCCRPGTETGHDIWTPITYCSLRLQQTNAIWVSCLLGWDADVRSVMLDVKFWSLCSRADEVWVVPQVNTEVEEMRILADELGVTGLPFFNIHSSCGNHVAVSNSPQTSHPRSFIP